jgi:hypothetical protein
MQRTAHAQVCFCEPLLDWTPKAAELLHRSPLSSRRGRIVAHSVENHLLQSCFYAGAGMIWTS